VTTETKEPEFEIVAETLQHLELCIYAIADYSDYYCDIKCINFDDTLMFQVKILFYNKFNFTTENEIITLIKIIV
jgi:hypothetical protein